jgi:hypothetical protein
MKELIKKIFLGIWNILKIIWKFLLKNWGTEVLIALLILFYFFKDQTLLIGGSILLFAGIKNYFIPGLKEGKIHLILIGLLTIYSGIIAVLSKILLSYNVDIFILIVLIIFSCILLAYSAFMKYLDKKVNFFIALPILFVAFLMTFLTAKGLINNIAQEGFSNGYIYFSSIILFLILIGVCFLIFKLIFLLVKRYIDYPLFNTYFYLFLAVSTTILELGFFYLQSFSTNQLKDFLIILSLAFVTSFAFVSSVKNIMPKKKKNLIV